MAVSTVMKQSAGKIEPKSAHVSDSSVQPFLQPDFDAADYLNTALPPLSSSRGSKTVPLAELSAQLQTLLSQLTAQTSRLSSTLTQLTDDIIRSGSRLAYEVEVLRADTSGLTDTFENGLKKHVDLFAPNLQIERKDTTQHAMHANEPEFLQRLRTLTTVRQRLDSVIKAFGSAMQWPLAPSELSLTSSLISVSAPESNDDSRSREEKGKEYVMKLRNEVTDLLSQGMEGLETANRLVEDLRQLAELWRGTAEEKARYKIVDSLQKLVDDKQKTVSKPSTDSKKSGLSPARGYDYRYGKSDAVHTAEGGSGYGFLQNLRNFKNEVYTSE